MTLYVEHNNHHYECTYYAEGVTRRFTTVQYDRCRSFARKYNMKIVKMFK